MAEIKERNTLTTPIVAANLAKVTKVHIQSLFDRMDKTKALGQLSFVTFCNLFVWYVTASSKHSTDK